MELPEQGEVASASGQSEATEVPSAVPMTMLEQSGADAGEPAPKEEMEATDATPAGGTAEMAAQRRWMPHSLEGRRRWRRRMQRMLCLLEGRRGRQRRGNGGVIGAEQGRARHYGGSH